MVIHAREDTRSKSAGRPDGGTRRAAFTLLVCALLAALTVHLQNRTPEPLPAAAAPADFSAARALGHLQVVAARPHPIGSREHAAVRDYISGELAGLGLEPSPQETTVVNRRWGLPFSAGRVRNVAARLRGAGGGRAILLACHYDSVPTSPGAGDDGSGVVTLLEAARALKAGPPLVNDVIFLFTDGEEVGLLGAAAFVAEHPWAKDVGLVLNFEARGNGGPAVMFETSGGNGELISGFAAGAPHPAASSLYYEIYKRLPNDTDFTVLRALDAPGLNFAFLDGIGHYHTLLDDPREINPGSVQHHGSYAVGLARHFGGAPLADTKAADAVYFNVLGSTFVHYPGAWVVPLLILATLLFVLVVVRGFRGRELTAFGVAFGFLGLLEAMVVSVAAVWLAWRLVLLAGPALRAMPWGEPYRSGGFRVAFVLLAVAAASALYVLLRRWARAENLAAGALLWWLALSVFVSVSVPGASYLFTLPLLFVLAARALVASPRLHDTPWGRVLTAAAFVPGVVLLAPVVNNIFVALTLSGSATAAVFVVLLCALLLPPLLTVADAAGWKLPALLALAAVCLAAAGILLAGFDRQRPRVNNVFYALDADAGRAVWASADEGPDEWTRQFFGAGAVRQSMAEFFPNSTREYLKAPAPAVPVAAPEARLIGDRTAGDVRTVTFRVTSPRGAPVVSVFAEPGVEVLDAAADGKPAGGAAGGDPAPAAPSKNWGVNFYGLPEAGADIVLKTRAGRPLKLLLLDRSYGLPQSPALPVRPRPEEMMPAPHWTSGTTFVVRRLVF